MGEFVMPSLGADMDEGTVVEWLVKEGDVVAKGDIVAVVDTTKSAIEVEVFEPGVVEKILVEPGTTVPVGTPLALLGDAVPSAEPPSAAGEPPSAAGEPSAEPPSAEPPSAMILEKRHAHEPPDSRFSKIIGEGGLPRGPEPAVASPIVRHLAHEKGVELTTVTGTGPDGVITREDVMAAAEAAPTQEPAPASTREPPARPTPVGAPGRVAASPLARRTAAELGVDLSTVEGSGARGAVTVADVRRAAATSATSDKAALDQAPATRPPTAKAEPSEKKKRSTSAPSEDGGSAKEAAKKRAAAMRSTIASLMARSKKEIPHYYLRTTVDFSAADAFIRRYNDGRPVSERLLPAAVMLKAAALAVRKVPEVNGFFTDGAFQRSDHVHLGVAVSLRGGGLVAPAIHDADQLELGELMARLKDLVARTRAGRLRGSEMSDPTITVTNLGEQGVEVVHGIIYPPQVALVGFGTVVQRPWAVDGMLTVRPILTATLAADHRVSDGHRGGIYLSYVQSLLQRPEEL